MKNEDIDWNNFGLISEKQPEVKKQKQSETKKPVDQQTKSRLRPTSSNMNNQNPKAGAVSPEREMANRSYQQYHMANNSPAENPIRYTLAF